MNETQTNQININVDTHYLSSQSDPDNEQYVFSYTITIQNSGSQAAQLQSRHWIITDANGHVQEVRGEGVVGEQPLLRAGDAYQYSSGAMLQTPVGSMQGSYQMVGADGTKFDAAIPIFTLSTPNSLN